MQLHLQLQRPMILLSLLAVATLITGSHSAAPARPVTVPFNRTSFPPGFVFGAGSAAYQSEGAANIDGRGPSIWDTYTKQQSERITDGSNGDVADDFYHRYKDDIKLMKKIGLDSFRFSISWTRIFPKGRGEVNHLGVKFYNDLIDELLRNRLTPFVTIYHWDLPQTLWDEYGGFLSSKLVKDYVNYADFCFKTFGDRVKHWVTFNEPESTCVAGFNTGNHAPGRCSDYVGNCTAGNSATEPYIAGHNLLLSHAAAVKLYRQKYQKNQKGQIGITLVTHWFEPKFKTASSRRAASRALDFYFGWFASPIIYGYYPKSMVSLVGDRLPKFTKSESKALEGSYDFVGVNYYTTNYAEDVPPSNNNANRSFFVDMHTTLSTSKNGVAVGTPTALNWLFIRPKGIRQLMNYIKDNYKNPNMYITENGVAEVRNDSIPIKVAIKDAIRIRYYDGHLRSLQSAIKDGANVKGFYVWSFFDDFEWDAGYTVRFGIVYVDFKNNLRRYLKYSAYWLKSFLLK